MNSPDGRGNGDPPRWRDIDRIDKRLERVEEVKAGREDLREVREDIGETQALVQTMLVEVATLRTKMGLGSALGSMVGGGLVAFVVYLATGSG